jgi:hypothetical protein
MNTDFEYKGLVIAFVSALIWNHRGNPGGKAAGDDLADDIETAFLRLSVTLPSKNAWLEAEELRAKAFAEALKLRDESVSAGGD